MTGETDVELCRAASESYFFFYIECTLVPEIGLVRKREPTKKIAFVVFFRTGN